MHSSSSPRAAAHDVPGHRRPAVREQHGHPPTGLGALQLRRRHLERADEVGRAEAPQGQDVSDHLRRGLGMVLGLGDDDVLSEGEHAVVRGRAVGDRGRGQRGGGQRPAAHGPAAIDDQAQCRPPLAPAPHAQALGVGRSAVGASLGQRLEAGIEVEVAGLGLEGLGEDAADPPLAGASTPAHVDDDPPSQPAGQLPQAGIGRAGEVGEQGEGLVRVLLQQALERVLVELADLGRHLLEAPVAGQLAARRGAPGRLGHRLVRGRTLPHEGELVAPVGAPAFPWPPPSVRRPNTSPRAR